MMGKTYFKEIYLSKKFVTIEEWNSFFQILNRYIGFLHSYKIMVRKDEFTIRYFLECDIDLSTMLPGINYILLKDCEVQSIVAQKGFMKMGLGFYNLIEAITKNGLKGLTLKGVDIEVLVLGENHSMAKTYVYEEKSIVKKRRVLFTSKENILAIDFSLNDVYSYKKFPKYLEIQKVLHLLKNDKENSILSVDVFPYLKGHFYLDINDYNFDKHSLVLGSSGSGKSKFLCLLVSNIMNNAAYKQGYDIIIIDPHAAIEEDIGGLSDSQVIDFKTDESSINLFNKNCENVISNCELLLDLFKSLISTQYNSKLERMLRHLIHLLLLTSALSFKNMRSVLLDAEYRNEIIKKNSKILPDSVKDFFLQDFNELRTKSYNDTIAPIITFIDEMQLLPVFNKDELENDIYQTIKNKQLTIFSLDSTILGTKIVKTLSGLIMQQILKMVESRKSGRRIILIIDEVAVIENPILLRILSEARKYGLSLILAGQHFDQISEPLQNSIFANVLNYYLFRISKKDASILARNISLKVKDDASMETKENILTNLNDRECISRITANGLLLPSFKAKTLDFISVPRKVIEIDEVVQLGDDEYRAPKKKFSIDTKISLNELLLDQSSSRRNMRGETK